MREAFERALDHAQRAAAESVGGVRALLDAASIGVLGSPAETNRSLGELANLLEQLERQLSGEAPSFRSAAINTVLGAVNREIERWEARSEEDPDARAVLRIFIGMREVLWELGMRPPQKKNPRAKARTSKSTGRTAPRAAADTTRARTKRSNRVQRIPIQR
ncbi:MAG: hypothetical protein QF570_13720 [Myxococcota bacterium]|jgi:hypothetical protein|nr:hypothetical protein [Myxococcota bacterium]